MSEQSPRLALPYLMPAQAQKHVTHNEALARLDLLVQLVLEATDAETPPASPQAGEIWALGAAPTGVWAGQGGRLAAFVDGSWQFLDPAAGWLAVERPTASLRVWDGAAWVPPPPGLLDNLPGLGVNATSDSTNRLVVAAPATLLTHEGAGHQLKINKAGAGDTASLLFQSGWSGRAEFGLAGSDAFSVKVSADGGSWKEALVADPASGNVTVPRLASGRVTVADDAVAEIATPGAGGFVLLTMVDPDYPQPAHSGIFVYDSGASPELATLAALAGIENQGTAALTGTTGTDGSTAVAVAAGKLLIENRSGASRSYSYSFIGGW